MSFFYILFIEVFVCFFPFCLFALVFFKMVWLIEKLSYSFFSPLVSQLMGQSVG